MPDVTQGDAGLEGFSTDGHGFQAYHPEPGKAPAQLRKALRDKIGDDLEKLERYSATWEKILNGRPLHFWRVVIPKAALRNKNVVEHAAVKAQELVKKQLPFIASDFQALVSTPEDFPAALRVISPTSGTVITIPITAITDTVLKAFERDRAAKVAVLDGKLAFIPRLADPAPRLNGRRVFLRRYLEYRSGLDWLEQRFPTARETILLKEAGLRRAIETEGVIGARQPPERLERAHQNFRDELDRAAPFIESTRREQMAWGVVVEWLLDCPLDFAP